MKVSVIDAMLAAMDLLSTNDRRVEYLFQVAWGGKSELDYESYLQLEEGMVDRYFDGHSCDFSKMLREFWKPQVHLPLSYLSGLGHSMLHFLDDVLSGIEKDQINDTVCSLIFYDVVFFAQMAIDSSSTGSAKKLLRTFGEKCAQAGCSNHIARCLASDPLTSPEILNAFAEGVIKHAGAWRVLRICRLGEQAQLLSPSCMAFQVEALKEDIRCLCETNTDMQSNLDARRELIVRLGSLIGSANARKWFAHEFPHLVA